MNALKKNFLGITICVSLLLIHLLFIILDVNIYQYLFWPYLVAVIGIIIFAAVVFSRMEKLMNKIGPDLVMSKYKKISRSISFWGMFVLMTLLLYADIYCLGQFFVPKEDISRIILKDHPLIGWGTFLPFSVLGTVLVYYAMKIVIMAKFK